MVDLLRRELHPAKLHALARGCLQSSAWKEATPCKPVRVATKALENLEFRAEPGRPSMDYGNVIAVRNSI